MRNHRYANARLASSAYNNVMSPHRYLVQFDPKRTAHYFTDVLVIGAGIAGLRAAMQTPADLDVLVVSKEKIENSNSSWAQGGIAGVMSPEDTFEN
ncbi:MAG: FAD-dependent oxidoreductase, partial [Planctomycetota bacterium]